MARPHGGEGVRQIYHERGGRYARVPDGPARKSRGAHGKDGAAPRPPRHRCRVSRKRSPPAQWTDARHVRGLRGELEALAYLVSCGWSIEAHRFKLGRHDVDLVARRGRTVAFVEVKTRSGPGFGTPAEAVRARKRAILARVAEHWRVRYGRRGDEYRFDVVEVLERPGAPVELAHRADAWRPT